MKTTSMKKFLLAGTAIVAVGSFAAQANAAVVAQTLTGGVEWATDGDQNQSPADGTGAAAGDTVNLATFTLTVTDDGANSDGTAAANFVLGAVTGTTGDLAIVDAAAGDGTLVVTVDSFATTSTGDFTVNAIDAETGTIAVTVTNDLTTGGVLSVINTETSSADTVLLTVSDDLTVTGATTLTAGANAGATSAITVTDDAAFTAAVTATGGAGAGSTATLTIGGDATFTAGVSLATNDKSILVLNGASSQAVSGVISGAGDINVTNNSSGGVTFSGDSTFTGELTVNNDTKNQAVTFTGDFAGAIGLGDNVTADTITANFNGTTLAISGGITGGAAETVNVNFLGGSTITLSGAAAAGIDTAAVSGSTTVTTNQNFGATTLTVASGSTFATTANTVTATSLVNSGTLLFGGGSVTAAITGTGALDVNGGGTFTGAVTQSSADIAAVTLTQGSASGYTIGSTNFSGAGTLALFNGSQTVTGNFTNTTDGQGTITIADGAGTTTIVGDLGASTSHSLAALTLGGGNTQTVTTTGDLFVDVIAVDDADILQFLGTGAQTVSGVIRGVGANDGVITVGNGTTATPTVTFSGLLGGGGNDPGALTVNTGATAVFAAGGTHEVDGTITNTGTIQIAAGDTLSTAGASLDASVGQYNIVVGKTAGVQTNGTLIEAGDDVNLANDTVHFVVSSLQPLTAGASVLGNVFQGNAQNTIAGATVTDNSFLYSFALVNDTNNVDVTVALDNTIEQSASASFVGSGNILLDDLATSANAGINTLQGELVAASTAEEVNDVLEAVSPTVDGGSVAAGLATASQTTGLTNTRLAMLRTGEAQTGMAAGNVSQGLGIWAQGFGLTADQEERDGVSGYDLNTYGFAVGVDTETLAEDFVIGLGLSYANSEIESENLASTETDVDTYQLTLYGNYDVDDRTYVSGQLGYAWGDNDQSRTPFGLTADADYDSDTFLARLETGRDYKSGGATITPKLLANYVHYSADDYAETGTAGGALLNVDNDSVNLFEVGVGVDASWMYQQSNGAYLKPALHAGLRHDLIGDEVEATGAFQAAPATVFETQGADPASTTLNLGAGVTYYTTDNWELSAGYDFEVKSDYDAHSGILRAGYKF